MNLFTEKMPAAIQCFSGFGKLALSLQVKELGNIETPKHNIIKSDCHA